MFIIWQVTYRQLQHHDVVTQGSGAVLGMGDGSDDPGSLFGSVVAGEGVVSGGDCEAAGAEERSYMAKLCSWLKLWGGGGKPQITRNNVIRNFREKN